MFGVVFARLYVSASDALPIAAASTTTRSRPVSRESSVPAATAALERARPARALTLIVDRLAHVAGRRRRRRGGRRSGRGLRRVPPEVVRPPTGEEHERGDGHADRPAAEHRGAHGDAHRRAELRAGRPAT